MNSVLTIAGSDCSGGAGIQADLKTIAACGLYGMSAITSVTAQNTLEVIGIYDVSPKCLKEQLDAVFSDIFPNAVKIGMVSSAALIEIIAGSLKKYRPPHVVLDPVMVSSSGCALLAPTAKKALISLLFPVAELITPNIPEAEVLSEIKISSEDDMRRSAEIMSEKFNTAVLLKGGHLEGNDLLMTNEGARWIKGEYFSNSRTHGSGCTLSSAIASFLAKGGGLTESVLKAKKYVSGAIRSCPDIGHGSAPLNHIWNIREKEEL